MATSSRLPLYGEPIFRWRGRGTLHFADGTTEQVAFQARQLRDGAIVVLAKGSEFRFGQATATKLTGTTNSSEAIVFTLTTPSNSSFSSRRLTRGSRNTSTYYWFAGDCRVQRKSRSKARSIAFGIVNLEFPLPAKSTLAITVARSNIRFHPLPDYEVSIAQAKYQNTTRLTATADCAAARHRVKSRVLLVSDACQLLSFARGTIINWIYYEVLNARGDVIQSVHENRITRSFSSLAPIDLQSCAVFVENTFRTLRSDRLFRFRRAIHSVIDAKSRSFLETRGIAACVAVEYLVTRWGTTQTTGWRRQKLGSRLLSMNKTLSLGIPVRRLRWFVKARNSLVHEAQFLTGQANWRQYLRLIQILDTMYARLLGYQGPVSDYAMWGK